MSIIREPIPTPEQSVPCTLVNESLLSTNRDWFSPLFLSATNYHPMDDSIQHTTNRTFFVRWFDHESDGIHNDTTSVTVLLTQETDEIKVVSTASCVHDERRETGIELHSWIECILNGFPMETSNRLHQQACSYYTEQIRNKLVPWRTEMAIRSASDIRVVGVVDALFFDPLQPGLDGLLQLHMKDWKYSQYVSEHYMREYTLQMNMYKYILESQYTGVDPFWVAGCVYTGLSIVSMELVVFHETCETYSIYAVADEQKYVSEQLLQRKKRIMTTQ